MAQEEKIRVGVVSGRFVLTLRLKFQGYGLATRSLKDDNEHKEGWVDKVKTLESLKVFQNVNNDEVGLVLFLLF